MGHASFAYNKKSVTRFLERYLTVFLIVINVLFVVSIREAAADNLIDHDLETALLKEDWSKVTELLNTVTLKTSSPVLRMIKGHASLAMNRNNESLSLFASMTFEDLSEWGNYAEKLVSRHHAKSVAHYFVGDANSRSEKFDKAYTSFTKSLDINRRNILAWNARGVVSTLRGDYKDAMTDLNEALSIKPDFVDAMNSIGMMRVAQSQGRRGAMKRFRAVIDGGHDFALAYHGLGCIQILTTERPEPEENKNLQKALELSPSVQELFIENEARFTNAFLDKQAENLFVDAGEGGTAIKRDYKIVELTSKLNKYNNQQFSQNSNIVSQKYAKFRGVRTEQQIVREAKDMSQGDLNRTALSRPSAIGAITNSASTQMKLNDIERKLDAPVLAISRYVVEPAASLVKSPAIPFVGAAYTGAKDKILDVKSRRHASATNLMRKSVAAQDFGIQEHITKGKWDAKVQGYKMANPHTASRTSVYRPSQSPAGYANSIGVGMTQPGERSGMNTFRPAGATTNKAHVTWDDSEWPFIALFGLLYFTAEQGAQKGEL